MTSAPHLVVFTGSGISAESGIQTFRASDGFWEDHPVEEVATPQGWRQDPERVLAFYNQRRDQIRRAKPNANLGERSSFGLGPTRRLKCLLSAVSTKMSGVL